MRLLLLSSEFPPGPGGIGTHAHRLTGELAALGWTSLVVTSQDYVAVDEISRFNRVQPFRVSRLRPIPFAPVEAGYRLQVASQHIKQYKPDVLLASGSRAVWLAAILASRHRIPWVAIGHGTEFGVRTLVSQRMTRWAFSRATVVVCVSEFTRRQMIAAGIRPRSSHVIENGADPSQFTLLPRREIQDFRRSLGFGNFQLLLTVGRVSERKGQSAVICALPHVLKKAPKTHYLVVGLPTKERQYRELANKLGVSAHVHFMGRVEAQDLLRFMNVCEAFVMTSRHTADGDFEGYGIAVVEAALCGKPAVVSANSGLTEAIIDGVTGYAVEPDNPQAVARALIRLLRNKDLRRHMGQAARERALREQTWEHRAHAYDTLLRGMLTSQASSRVKILERERSTSEI
jgi:phosphatidylinositol alpha-1,6-mannosyltransferase